MTLYEFIIPVIALSVAGIGIFVLHLTDKKNRRDRHHPAE